MSNAPLLIRPETESDIEAIYAITQAAFADREFSGGTEGPIINALRADGDLTLSLVAEREGEIVGQITFSPVSIAGEIDGLYALGPVAVRPELRHQRIGSKLIREGLSQLQDRNAKACVLIGDPAYYSRFGFIADCGLTYKDVPVQAVQALIWDGQVRAGEIHYSPAFAR